MYRVSFYYRASRADRTCPFNASPTSAPCPFPFTPGAPGAPAALPAGAPADDLPFGYTGDDEQEFQSTATPPGGAQAAATAATPLYQLIYAWRKPNGTFSAANDGYWKPFAAITWLQGDPVIEHILPDSSWREFRYTLAPTPNNGASPNNFVADSLSFGVQLGRNGALGRVAIDVDNFSYCRVSNDPSDPVVACLP